MIKCINCGNNALKYYYYTPYFKAYFCNEKCQSEIHDIFINNQFIKSEEDNNDQIQNNIAKKEEKIMMMNYVNGRRIYKDNKKPKILSYINDGMEKTKEEKDK